ncbi:hypothetical protein Lalb_Chr10g0094411 [Lupinus albus]|uniref:Uncharacterized protein n=1 Tax=Lupinus albus TaxID=3870 RepID=A0A6A4PU46_LUPAL|nr:hypothetical protein Lalb_Chr10g0094411 [Lupinus albus]
MLIETILHHWNYFSQKRITLETVRSLDFRIPEACVIALNFLLEICLKLHVYFILRNLKQEIQHNATSFWYSKM